METFDIIEQARAAVEDGAWLDACDLYAKAPELGSRDLETYADALWWSSRMLEAIDVRQRAYAAYSSERDARRSAYNAWFLSFDYDYKGDVAVAQGWLKRAKRDLAGIAECAELALVLCTEGHHAHVSGDLAGARRLAEEAFAIGQRVNDPGVASLSILTVGRTMMDEGHVAEGMALLDEAMTSVVAGLVGPLLTGLIYCNVLGACWGVADLRRASEWTDAAIKWCDTRAGDSMYHGVCSVHRVELQALRGAWGDAEAAARRVGADLASVAPSNAAWATYELGEILRLRGDLPAAEEAFRVAHEMGRDPQPGLALLRLAQGRVEAAVAALRLPLQEAHMNPMSRSRLLIAHVEVSLAAGDANAARAACEELDGIAARWESPALEALASSAGSQCALAAGDAETASLSARRAVELFQSLRLPHAAARARMTLGLACRAAGDEDRARREIAAARSEFERLGARPDARTAAAALGSGEEAPGGLSDREIEVLRLVCSGRTNREIANEMVLSEHTIGRHLQNIFRKLDVSSRAAATAYAFENGLV